MAGNAHNDRVHIEATERQQKCLDMRITGMTFRQIGEALGLHESTVREHIWGALKKLAAQRDSKASELRELELQKLDSLERAARITLTRHRVCYTQGGKIVVDIDEATGQPYKLTDDGPVLAAIGKLLDVGARRAKLLGLDAPTRQETSGPAGGPLELAVQHDLSKLSDEELDTLRGIIAKTESTEGEHEAQ